MTDWRSGATQARAIRRGAQEHRWRACQRAVSAAYGPLVLIQVGQHFGHVAGRIDVRVDPGDSALRVDHVSDPCWILRARIVGRAVGEPNHAIHIAEQIVG